MMPDYQYYLVYKPYNMLCQFTPEVEGDLTLADLGVNFAKDVYSIGRLDKDSEGLLLLSNDKRLHQTLLHPSRQHERTYWVQVEGLPTAEALAQLRAGVDLRIDKKPYRTLPAQVEILDPAPSLPDRQPPIRYRAAIPTTWLALSLTEGKNRQVRRMTAAVGFPTLRLVRAAIGRLTLRTHALAPGECIALQTADLQLILEKP